MREQQGLVYAPQITRHQGEDDAVGHDQEARQTPIVRVEEAAGGTQSILERPVSSRIDVGHRVLHTVRPIAWCATTCLPSLPPVVYGAWPRRARGYLSGDRRQA